MQWLILTGRFKVQVNYKALENYENPKCSACEFGKVHCRSNKVNTINNNPMKAQYIKKYHMLPVHMVSADHYLSRAPGMLYHTKGKSYPSAMLSGGFVFIDHYSGYVSIKNQLDINSTGTVKANLTFER